MGVGTHCLIFKYKLFVYMKFKYTDAFTTTKPSQLPIKYAGGNKTL